MVRKHCEKEIASPQLAEARTCRICGQVHRDAAVHRSVLSSTSQDATGTATSGRLEPGAPSRHVNANVYCVVADVCDLSLALILRSRSPSRRILRTCAPGSRYFPRYVRPIDSVANDGFHFALAV